LEIARAALPGWNVYHQHGLEIIAARETHLPRTVAQALADSRNGVHAVRVRLEVAAPNVEALVEACLWWERRA
jgi:hypothetical protein